MSSAGVFSQDALGAEVVRVERPVAAFGVGDNALVGGVGDGGGLHRAGQAAKHEDADHKASAALCAGAPGSDSDFTARG